MHVLEWALGLRAWLEDLGGNPGLSANFILQVCFRLGLFGLDKLASVSKCVKTFETALDNIIAKNKSKK